MKEGERGDEKKGKGAIWRGKGRYEEGEQG